jgi:hypothetical protein
MIGVASNVAVQVPRKVADLIRPDAPAAEARDALELGSAAVADTTDFQPAGSGTVPDPLTVSIVQGSTASGGNLTIRSTSHATKGTVTVEGKLSCPGSGTGSEAFGAGAVASDIVSVAVGANTSVTGAGGTGIGCQATVSGFLGTALGRFASSTHTGSLALGFHAATTADYQCVMGGENALINTLVPCSAIGGFALAPQGISGTSTLRDLGKVGFTWADSADTTRKGKLSLLACDASGTDKEGLFVASNGTTADVVIPIANVRNAADDTAAAALSPPCPIGGIYRTASVLKIRVT